MKVTRKKDSSGIETWIFWDNISGMRYAPVDGKTTIYFAGGQQVEIQGAPKQLLDASEDLEHLKD